MTDRAERAQRLRSAFATQFGRSPEVIVRAPGRANLLGEHVDYNDGFVLPVAIDREVLMAVAHGQEGRARFYSLDFDERAEADLSHIAPDPEQRWSNYPRGALWALLHAGRRVRGVDMAFTGNVPIGGGLSSSAALEVATAYALQQLYDMDMGEAELAKICQRAENIFVGVPCGIMDQFISVVGKKDHAARIDCRSLRYEHVPLPPDGRVVTADTGVRRELASSEYAVRRAQCEEAVRILLAEGLPGIAALRDVSLADFERHAEHLPEEVRRRARHVVTEGVRMEEGVAALRTGNLTRFGELMYETHASLRDDYEVSSPELEALVAAARAEAGCYGSRLTGAGFGGSTVNLVAAAAVEDFSAHVSAAYQQATNREATIVVCQVEDGASLVEG